MRPDTSQPSVMTLTKYPKTNAYVPASNHTLTLYSSQLIPGLHSLQLGKPASCISSTGLRMRCELHCAVVLHTGSDTNYYSALLRNSRHGEGNGKGRDVYKDWCKGHDHVPSKGTSALLSPDRSQTSPINMANSQPRTSASRVLSALDNALAQSGPSLPAIATLPIRLPVSQPPTKKRKSDEQNQEDSGAKRRDAQQGQPLTQMMPSWRH